MQAVSKYHNTYRVIDFINIKDTELWLVVFYMVGRHHYVYVGGNIVRMSYLVIYFWIIAGNKHMHVA